MGCESEAMMVCRSAQTSVAPCGKMRLMKHGFTSQNSNGAGRIRSVQMAKYRHKTARISLFSNRQFPELESGVSYRKQRIGPISNRHKIAKCILANQRNDN